MSLAERENTDIQAAETTLSPAARAMVKLFLGDCEGEVVQHFYLPDNSENLKRFTDELGIEQTDQIKPHEVLGLNEQAVRVFELEALVCTRVRQSKGASFVVRQTLPTEQNKSLVTFWARRT